jgi:hypothetical protein
MNIAERSFEKHFVKQEDHMSVFQNIHICSFSYDAQKFILKLFL